MSDNQHMYNRQYIQAVTARDIKNAEAKKNAFDRELALNAVRMRRFITHDEAMKTIRSQVGALHAEVMDKMSNPAKRSPDETSDILIAKFQCYKNVLDIFDGLEKYGEKKGKELKALNGKGE